MGVGESACVCVLIDVAPARCWRLWLALVGMGAGPCSRAASCFGVWAQDERLLGTMSVSKHNNHTAMSESALSLGETQPSSGMQEKERECVCAFECLCVCMRLAQSHCAHNQLLLPNCCCCCFCGDSYERARCDP